MRHKAPRRFTLLWRRLPRATAGLIRGAASPGPARALVAGVLVLCLGAGAYTVLMSVAGGHSDSQAGSVGIDPAPGPTGSPDREPRRPTPEVPATDDRTPSDSRSGRGATGQPETSSPTGVTSPSPSGATSPSTSEQGTASARTGPPTPAPPPSPPQSSATATTKQLDRTPPDTRLTSEFPADDAALFSFSANEPGSFACSLDGAGYTPCDVSASYTELHPGWHTFAVRATDAAGNVDPSPAEASWHATPGGATDD